MKEAGIDLGKYTGPDVVIDIEDHRETGSWGSSNEAKKYREDEAQMIREGDFSGAIDMGIDDLLDIAEATGDENKYNDAIEQMIEYFGTLDPDVYTPKGGRE
jgi:filamentous hemagglutinin